MELVEGPDLKQWLASAPRSTTDIISVFADAGRGLTAAHRAGLVHRDFKPENVLVGGDRRVRVTDFGLAQPLVGERAGVSFSESSLRQVASRFATRTETGSLAGTPAYMAAELFQGRSPMRGAIGTA